MRFITGFIKPKKCSLGTDFAGIIEETGSHVKSFKVGDRVFGFDDNGIRSHAEYTTIAEKNAMSLIPENISFEQAAASIEGVHYARNFINRVPVKKGDKIIVNGATGAIGSSLVQILYHWGVEVTAVCRGEHAKIMQSIGAKNVIDYTKEDFTRSEEKYNFIFDAVGKSTFSKCKPLLKEGGAYISSELGPYAQNLLLAVTTSVFGKKKVKFPVPLDKKASVHYVIDLFQKDIFDPLIDRRYTLEQIAEAFTYVESGRKTGSVVLSINQK